MKPLNQIVILGVIGAAVAAAWFYDVPALLRSNDPAATPARATASRNARPVVLVRPVRFSSSAQIVEAVGTAKALQEVVLFPDSEGRITAVNFKGGQRVGKGDLLIQLENEDERLAVELAKVNLARAKLTLDRYRSVAAGRAVTRNQMDTALAQYRLAKVQLAKAEYLLRTRSLVAPFDGIVGLAKVHVGDRVSKTTEIATLDDRSALIIEFEVPASLAYGVRKGAAFKAKTWARRGEMFDGTITGLDSRIDEKTRTLRVRARLDNTDDRLRPGMAFSITLPLAGRRYPSVPAVAIRWERTGAYLWTVRDGKAVRVSAEVIKRNDGWVLVDASLKEGEPVIVEGLQSLRPGRAVRQKPWAGGKDSQ